MTAPTLLKLTLQASPASGEHLAGWTISAVSIARERDDDGYGVAVAILTNPKLGEGMDNDTITREDKLAIIAQTVKAAEAVLAGFLGMGE